MSRIFNRPMFKRGGSAGQGITTGLAPRKGYQFGERVTTEDIIKSYGPAPRSSNVYDFLTDWGLRMASASPQGNVIQTAAAEAIEPYSNLRKGKGEAARLDYAMRAQASDAARAHNLSLGKLDYEKERDVADRDLQKYLGELEAKGEKEFIVEQINNYWDPLIEAAPPSERENLAKQKQSDTYNVIVLGEDISDKYKILTNEAAYSLAIGNAEEELQNTINAETKANWASSNKGYNQRLQKLINKYLRLATKFLDPDKKAKGGRVGYQNAGPVTASPRIMSKAATDTEVEDAFGVSVSEKAPVRYPNQGSPSLMAKAATDTEVEDAFGVSVEEAAPETNEINISYEQLRNRLPPEVKDDIVLLLSQSYEAFADFAEIQTQADVNEFNIKYNVQLFLPQQTGV